MNEYFEHEILQTKREILRLKTSAQKSAGVVPMIERSMNISIQLQLNSSQLSSTGEKLYRVVTNEPTLFIPTLDWYFENVMENDHFPYLSRSANVTSAVDYLGNNILRINVRGNETDTRTLIDGGSVSISVKLTIQSSDEFSLEEI